MLYSTQDIRQLIAKLYRDLRLSDGTYDLDFVEWIGEALSHVGAYTQLDKKEAVLEVENHRAALPMGMVQLLAVLSAENAEIETIQDAAKIALLPSPDNFHIGVHQSAFKDGDLAGYDYNLTPGYIHLPFETGVVVISYLALPLSEDGFPLVPDDVSFGEACKWYCATRLTEGGWQHPGGLTYADCEQRWLKYCTQARNIANMPDPPSMERFMRSWVQLIPDFQASLRQYARGVGDDGTPLGTSDIDLS